MFGLFKGKKGKKSGNNQDGVPMAQAIDNAGSNVPTATTLEGEQAPMAQVVDANGGNDAPLATATVVEQAAREFDNVIPSYMVSGFKELQRSLEENSITKATKKLDELRIAIFKYIDKNDGDLTTEKCESLIKQLQIFNQNLIQLTSSDRAFNNLVRLALSSVSEKIETLNFIKLALESDAETTHDGWQSYDVSQLANMSVAAPATTTIPAQPAVTAATRAASTGTASNNNTIPTTTPRVTYADPGYSNDLEGAAYIRQRGWENTSVAAPATIPAAAQQAVTTTTPPAAMATAPLYPSLTESRTAAASKNTTAKTAASTATKPVVANNITLPAAPVAPADSSMAATISSAAITAGGIAGSTAWNVLSSAASAATNYLHSTEQQPAVEQPKQPKQTKTGTASAPKNTAVTFSPAASSPATKQPVKTSPVGAADAASTAAAHDPTKKKGDGPGQ